jgi:hypothetical protein
VDDIRFGSPDRGSGGNAVEIPDLIVKLSVIKVAQGLNSHMRDSLFSNNNDELKVFF